MTTTELRCLVKDCPAHIGENGCDRKITAIMGPTAGCVYYRDVQTERLSDLRARVQAMERKGQKVIDIFNPERTAEEWDEEAEA